MKLAKFAIAAAGLVYGSAAMAENLVAFTKIDEEIGYYDIDSIRKDGETTLVWTYWDASKSKEAKYRNVRIRYRIDCKRELYNLEYIVSYSSAGKVLDSIDDANGHMEVIVPESVSFRLYSIICK